MNKGKLLIIILSVFVASFATSCCKKRMYCNSGELNIAFVGFQRGDIKSVNLKRYKTGQTFGKALDSAQLIYNGNTPVVANKKDTLWLSSYSTVGAISSIKAGNDWELFVSNTGHRIRFTDVGNEGHYYEISKCSGKEVDCVNQISYFVTNGTWNYGNTLYIQK